MIHFLLAIQQGALQMDDSDNNALEVHDLCASEVFMGHDTVFLTRPRCGASWSIHPVQTRDGNIASMDQLDEGDGYCISAYMGEPA